MNDNKLINLNFVDGMLEAVMHRFKKVDETMGAVLPEGEAAPYQQLVTDANGAAKWEDRTHYKGGFITFKISPENTYVENTTTEDVWYIAADRDRGNTTPEIRSAMRAITEDFVAHQSERKAYAVWWDGVRYTRNIVRLPTAVHFGDPNDVNASYMMVSSGANGVDVRVVSKDDAEHTFGYETFDYNLKPLDEDFIPTTVPVVQSASVGQTIVVKAVDDNGKPTEWEASDKLNELSEEMGKQAVIDVIVQNGEVTYSLKNMSYDELYARIFACSLLGVFCKAAIPTEDGAVDCEITWAKNVSVVNGWKTQTVYIDIGFASLYILPDGSITMENPNAE